MPGLFAVSVSRGAPTSAAKDACAAAAHDPRQQPGTCAEPSARLKLTWHAMQPMARAGILKVNATKHPIDKCGSNGLPLTLNSVKIFGRAQFLKARVAKQQQHARKPCNTCARFPLARAVAEGRPRRGSTHRDAPGRRDWEWRLVLGRLVP